MVGSHCQKFGHLFSCTQNNYFNLCIRDCGGGDDRIHLGGFQSDEDLELWDGSIDVELKYGVLFVGIATCIQYFTTPYVLRSSSSPCLLSCTSAGASPKAASTATAISPPRQRQMPIRYSNFEWNLKSKVFVFCTWTPLARIGAKTDKIVREKLPLVTQLNVLNVMQCHSQWLTAMERGLRELYIGKFNETIFISLHFISKNP